MPCGTGSFANLSCSFEVIVIMTRPKLPVTGQDIPYERFLDCVHCGLCTSACPTYVETGDENDSPRGRIYLMRSVVDGRLDLTNKVRHHLDLCLDCRSCETACPSGVQYGRLLEPFRVDMQQSKPSATWPAAAASQPDWFHRWILYGLFPHRRRLAWALRPAQWMQLLKLDCFAKWVGLHRLLPERLRRMQQQLPRLRPPLPPLPERLPAVGRRRAVVGLFLGCVADAMFRHVHWATARVLQKNGCDVIIPLEQQCCGAIHYHSGASAPAWELIRANVKAFGKTKTDAIVVNVAGCGSMLKDYAHIAGELQPGNLESEIADIVGRMKDVCEFLSELELVPPEGEIDASVAYQDACHLRHAQRIHAQPRQLLQQIPGIRLMAVAESELCCGAAGSYSLTQPEMADRLGRRRVTHLLATSPDIIVSGNAGCSLQLQSQLKQMGHRVPVMHPVELLDLSYRGENPVW